MINRPASRRWAVITCEMCSWLLRLFVNGEEVEKVSFIKFLGTHLNFERIQPGKEKPTAVVLPGEINRGWTSVLLLNNKEHPLPELHNVARRLQSMKITCPAYLKLLSTFKCIYANLLAEDRKTDRSGRISPVWLPHGKSYKALKTPRGWGAASSLEHSLHHSYPQKTFTLTASNMCTINIEL